MKHFNIRNFLAAIVAMSALSITACNTVEGVGEDTESVGRTIDDAANSRRLRRQYRGGAVRLREIRQR